MKSRIKAIGFIRVLSPIILAGIFVLPLLISCGEKDIIDVNLQQLKILSIDLDNKKYPIVSNTYSGNNIKGVGFKPLFKIEFDQEFSGATESSLSNYFFITEVPTKTVVPLFITNDTSIVTLYPKQNLNKGVSHALIILKSLSVFTNQIVYRLSRDFFFQFTTSN